MLSIDIDGNDYWIWNALEIISPKVVIIETHVMFGLRNIVVPYQHPASRTNPDYHGASPAAMVKLAAQKGYRLVGANDLGFNFIFVKNGVTETMLPEVDTVSVLHHPSVQQSFERYQAIAHLEYVTPIE